MKGFKIGRIFGIEVRIDWSLILLVVLIAWPLADGISRIMPEASSALRWGAGILAALLLVVSVFFHEMAHSLTAKKFKITIERITLFIFGGVAQFGSKSRFNSPASEFFIAIAGPVSSLFLVGLFFALRSLFAPSTLDFYICNWLFEVNLLLAIFNLIPCFPMDGGRVFRSICWRKTKDFVRATKIARDTARVFGILIPLGAFFWLGGWFSAIWVGFIVWLMIIPAAEAEYRQALLENTVKEKFDEKRW